jgi:uncharacterized protein involved in exopolysaccharide biosynthesis
MEMLDQDEISLRELCQIVWRQRLMVAIVTLSCAVIVGFIAWLLPNKYTATVVFSPVSNSSNGGRLGGIASQVGGLAAIAGISVGDDSNKAESLAVLQSQSLTERFIEANDLLPVLFADQWDPAAKKWLVTGKLQPTLWRANEEFERIRKVLDDKKAGVLSLSITWTDPVLAANWANGLLRLANEDLRAKAIVESERHIEYLKEQAAATDVAQLRTAIYSVLESEVKKVMLARGPGDYALKVLDPAEAPERPQTPKRILWVAIALFGGLVLSLVLVYLRATWSSGTSRATAQPLQGR